METTAQSSPVLPYTASRPKQPKRINMRLIVFLLVVGAIPAAFVGAKIYFDMHQGIEHNGDLDIVDLKALGFFTFDQQNGSINQVPRKWRELDGKKIQLEGFMFSGSSAAGQLSDFQFVYNVQKCCFNGPPLVQERVFAHVPHGREIPFYGDFCRLTGVLHVNVKKDESGAITSIYTFDVNNAELVN